MCYFASHDHIASGNKLMALKAIPNHQPCGRASWGWCLNWSIWTPRYWWKPPSPICDPFPSLQGGKKPNVSCDPRLIPILHRLSKQSTAPAGDWSILRYFSCLWTRNWSTDRYARVNGHRGQNLSRIWYCCLKLDAQPYWTFANMCIIAAEATRSIISSTNHVSCRLL